MSPGVPHSYMNWLLCPGLPRAHASPTGGDPEKPSPAGANECGLSPGAKEGTTDVEPGPAPGSKRNGEWPEHRRMASSTLHS